jgi:predicted nucleic acid-binding Zn ribbon protein
MQNIPPHRHCRECGKAISPDKQFCSQTCESSHKTKMRRRRNQLYTYYALLIIFLIIAFILLGFR